MSTRCSIIYRYIVRKYEIDRYYLKIHYRVLYNTCNWMQLPAQTLGLLSMQCTPRFRFLLSFNIATISLISNKFCQISMFRKCMICCYVLRLVYNRSSHTYDSVIATNLSSVPYVTGIDNWRMVGIFTFIYIGLVHSTCFKIRKNTLIFTESHQTMN